MRVVVLLWRSTYAARATAVLSHQYALLFYPHIIGKHTFFKPFHYNKKSVLRSAAIIMISKLLPFFLLAWLAPCKQMLLGSLMSTEQSLIESCILTTVILAQNQEPIYVPFEWDKVPASASVIASSAETTTYALIDTGGSALRATPGPGACFLFERMYHN